jgi:hypothetical protein
VLFACSLKLASTSVAARSPERIAPSI